VLVRKDNRKRESADQGRLPPRGFCRVVHDYHLIPLAARLVVVSNRVSVPDAVGKGTVESELYVGVDPWLGVSSSAASIHCKPA
jgi:hypothetical protein